MCRIFLPFYHEQFSLSEVVCMQRIHQVIFFFSNGFNGIGRGGEGGNLILFVLNAAQWSILNDVAQYFAYVQRPKKLYHVHQYMLALWTFHVS